MIIVCTIVINALAGQRSGLVTAVGPFFLTVACMSGKRVPRILAVILIVLSMFGFAFLRDLQNPAGGEGNAGETVSKFALSPGTQLLESLDGSDTEMVDALSLESNVIPSIIPFSPGSDAAAIFGAPIPRFIWPDKPLTMDNRLNGMLLGRGVNQASVAYSFAGEGWYVGGFIGVIVFMAGAGAAFARVRNVYRTAGNGLIATCLYSMATPLVVTLLRGALSYTLAYALFYIGPVLYLLWRSRGDEAASGHVRAINRKSDASPRRAKPWEPGVHQK